MSIQFYTLLTVLVTAGSLSFFRLSGTRQWKLAAAGFLAIAFLLAPRASTAFAQVAVNGSTPGGGQTVTITAPDGTTYSAYLHLPSDYNTSSKTYPLIVFLHGKGEAGTDLSLIYNNSYAGGPAYLAEHGQLGKYTSPTTGQQSEFIVLAPQATYFSTSGSGLNNLLKGFVPNYRVDTNRIYPTGLSAGGQGVVEFMVHSGWTNQYTAAAAIPMSEAWYYPAGSASVIAGDKVYNWGFGSDPADVFGTLTHNLMNEINTAAPRTARYTNYDGGHCCWNTFYDPAYKETLNGKSMNIYEWLLQYSRGGSNPPAIDPITLAPYGGTPRTIPGTIQIEDFDTGGEGLAYHDAEPANQPGKYRPSEGVDIENTLDSTGAYDVGWTAAGEWMKYSVNVTTAGAYTLSARVGALSAGSFTVDLDGTTIATVNVPSTGGYQTWQTVTTPTVSLTQGSHVMRIFMTTGNYNLNYLTFSAGTTTPSNQSPTANAGPDKAITLPTNSITLTGSGTDTDGTIASYSWTKTAGGAATISSPLSASTTITGLTQGSYTFRLTVTDNAGATAYDDVNVTVSASTGGNTAYNGPHNIPGTIQAEDFDNGGEGVAYHDNDSNNNGGAYRPTEGVDMEAAWGDPNGGGYIVGWIQGGEWIKYTVAVQTAGTYTLQARVASPAGAAFDLEVDGTPLTTVTVPNTGAWQTWQTVTIPNLSLTQGTHVLRTFTQGGNYNINYLTFTGGTTPTNQAPTANAGVDQTVTLPTTSVTLTGSGTDPDGTIASYAWTKTSGGSATISSPSSASTTVSGLAQGTYTFHLVVTDNAGATAADDVTVTVNSTPTLPPTAGSPYGGTARAIPGTIEAEDFDLGGEGVGYHDTDASNAGQKYRTSEGVDIADSGDANGAYTIGWTAAGEWTNYTVNVKTTGTYIVQARVATPNGGSLQVSFDGNAPTTITVPVTGSWSTWQTISVFGVSLAQGVHVMRVLNVTGNININYVVVTDNSIPQVNAGNDQTISMPTNSVTLTGTATDIDGTIASYSWTKVNGSTATITNPTSATTAVTGLAQGSYTFRLTATDNKGATAYDDVGITVYGQTGLSKPIAIDTETMVINENAVGNETKLFDEQSTLQIDANGNPVKTTTNPIACPDFWNEPAGQHACWSLFDTGGIREIVWPATLIVDLKAQYNVTDAYVFIESASANGTDDDLEIRASDDPFNFTNKVGGTKFQTATYPYQQWVRIPLTANNNRYLQLKITTGAGKIGEIVFYGVQNGNKVVENNPSPVSQLQHYPMDTFIGTNVSWGMGDGYDKDYDTQWGTLRTYSGYRWIFDANDNIQLGSPGQYSYDLLQRQLNAGTGEKPYNVEMGAALSMVDPSDPNYSTSSFSDRKAIDYTLCQGTIPINGIPSCHGIADQPESYAHKAYLSKKAAAAYGPGGQFKEEFIELGNEPDGSWNQAGYYTPYELAAMMSADYDGHCNTLRYNGQTVGAKNGDPNIKVMMPGIVAMGSGDMRYLKSMYFWWQHHRTCAQTIPTDVINFHFYSSSSGGQGTATGHGISPEDYGMRDMMKKTVDFRNKYAPKVDVAVTEFGYDSYPEVFPDPTVSWCKDAVFGNSIIATHPIGPYDTDEVQGQWIARSYLEMAAAGIDFSNQFWVADEYKLNTVCGTFAASGLVKQVKDAINWRPQYTPRPGWFYAQTLKNQLKGMKYDSDRDINGVRVMKFKDMNNGSHVAYVAWSPTSNGYINSNFTVPFDRSGIATPVELSVGSETGMVGTSTSGAVQSITVPVSERPIIILVSEDGTPITNGAPTANAGADQTITLPTNSVSLSGTGTDSDGTIASYAWTKTAGGTATISSPNSANTTVSGLTQGTYVFHLVVTDNQGLTGADDVTVYVNPVPNTAPAVNAGVDQTIALPTNFVVLSGTAIDAEQDPVTYVWTKTAGIGGTITTPTSATTTVTGLTQGSYTFSLAATDSKGATGTDTVTITVEGAPNAAPTANAGVDQTITLPANSVVLSGTGTDTDGTISSYRWTMVSGSGGSITSPTSASTSVTSLVEGVYVFRLQVTDNLGATATDDMTVTVKAAVAPVNANPVVNAGADIRIKSSISSVTLKGTATDSDGTIASTKWEQVSGGQATITSPSSLQTTVTGLTSGTYSFSLTATDNQGGIGTDTVVVTVSGKSSGGGGGKPPKNLTVSAGGDQTVTTTADALVLNGTAVAGDTADATVTYTWTKQSGGNGKISLPKNATTTATDLDAGTYVFTLTATDSTGETATDDTTVTVTEAPKAPAVPTSSASRIRINVGTTLRMRSAPNGPIVGSVTNGTTGTVLETKTGWIRVQFDSGTIAWVSSNYTAPAAASAAPTSSTPTVTAPALIPSSRVRAMVPSLNVISSVGGPVIGNTLFGTAGTVLGSSGNWVRVQFDSGITGWVSRANLAIASQQDAPTVFINTTPIRSTAATGSVTVISSTLNVRSSPAGTLIGKVTLGTSGTVQGRVGSWIKVKFPTITGYVSSTYVR